MITVRTILVLLSCLSLASGKVIEGTVQSPDTANNFFYLGKFCYDAPSDPNATSTFSYSIIPDDTGSQQYLAVYDDQSNSWPLAVKAINQNDCALASTYAKDLSTGASVSSLTPLIPGVTNSQVIRINEHEVPRWWYIVVLNCNGPVHAGYTMTFTQYNGSPWGFEAAGVLGLYVFFFLLYLALIALVLYFRVKSTYSHALSSAYLASLLFQGLALLLLVIHFGVFQSNGVGVPFFDGLASWLQEAAAVTLIFVFLIVGSGYTTELWTERKLFVILTGAYLLINIVLLIWYFAIRNASWETNFMYDSVAGIILMIFRLFLGGFLIVILRTTHMMESQISKKQFYVHVGVLGGLWLFLLPAVMLIFCALPSYYQMKMQLGLLVVFNTIAYIGLGFLFRPWFMAELYPLAAPLRTSNDLGNSFLRESNGDMYAPPTPAEIEAARARTE